MENLFQQRLHTARKSKGLTQQHLAEAMDVTRDTIRNWEHGRVIPQKLSVYEELAIILNVDKLWLMGEGNEVVLRKEFLQQISTDELLAELKRRIEEGLN